MAKNDVDLQENVRSNGKWKLYQLDKYIIQLVVISTTLMSAKGKIIILRLQEIIIAQHDNKRIKDKGKEEDHSGGMSFIAREVTWWNLKELDYLNMYNAIPRKTTEK